MYLCMSISIRKFKLRKLLLNEKKLVMELGKLRARKLQLRLEQLRFAETLADIRHMPGNYHELAGDRKGQFACDLDQPYRLIFRPMLSDQQAPESKSLIWSKSTSVEILEITDYH